MPAEGREAWLENVVKEYPYFSIAHYFLLREKGGLEFSPFQAARTALHFSHPFLLQARIQDGNNTLVDDAALPSEEVEEFNVHTGQETVAANEENEVLTSEPTERESEALDVNNNAGPGNKLPEMVFEPLHTTDYFASQGIKLSDEMLAQDKLGRQMRRFTDWLKTMKKIPGATDQVPVDISVKAIAENSNREEEVYTESMAEVYIEQQKFAKARDIYNKLSLLNPSKSAYFAAKLEKIKDN